MGDKTNGGNISTLAGSVLINVPFSLNVMLTSPILLVSCRLSKRSNFHCPRAGEPAEHPTLIGIQRYGVKTLKKRIHAVTPHFLS